MKESVQPLVVYEIGPMFKGGPVAVLLFGKTPVKANPLGKHRIDAPIPELNEDSAKQVPSVSRRHSNT